MKKINRYKHSILILTLALSAGVTTAYAFDTNDINESSYEKSFKDLDADNNGSLDILEAKKSDFFTKKHFALADVNHDGLLNQEEYTNYKSKDERKNLKRVASDSSITTKIKAKLLMDEGLKSFKVSVETHKGIVLLSGFVKTADQMALAEKIAVETEGVKSVKNRIEVKKEE